MKKWMVIIGLLIVLAAGGVSAQDTSPYLAGTWEAGTWTYSDTVSFSIGVWSYYEIVNPTTKAFDVYAVVYDKAGLPLDCWWNFVVPNGQWFIWLWDGPPEPYDYGTIKFFAFLAGSRKFDPNAIIGGFQQKGAYMIASQTDLSFSEANLKAVTINSMTQGEFSRVPPKGIGKGFCTNWNIQ
jgi:hypothetical protein